MAVFSHIVVATDLSERAIASMREAVYLAKRYQARLSILHVFDHLKLRALLVAATSPDYLEEEVLREAKSKLASQLAQLGAKDIRCEGHVILGSPLEELQDYLNEHAGDLLIVGQTGMSQLGQVLLGSTAERLIRYIVQPVMVVHQTHPAEIQHICVAVDMSENSFLALSQAARIARSIDAKLSILHVDDAHTHFPYLSLRGLFKEGHRSQAEEETRAQLEAWLETCNLTGLTTEVVLRSGTPASEIVRHAEESECDLLVLGSLGRTGVTRFLIGNTAESVARAMPCSLLVVKPAVTEDAPAIVQNPA